MVRIAAIFLAAASLAGAFALGQNATETREQPLLRGKHADDTDRAVLEALLLSVASDKDFPAPLADDKPVVVLHLRNPDTVEEIVNTSLLIQDTGGKVM